MRSIILAVSMALLAVTSQAGELQLSVAKTIHSGTDSEFNEIHPTVKYKEGDLFVGVYQNSEGNVSAMAGQRIQGATGIFMEYGVLTGYSSEPILPLFRVGRQLQNIAVFFAPARELTSNGVKPIIVVGIEFNL